MTKTRRLTLRAELLFGESIVVKLVVGSFMDPYSVGVAVHDWSVAGLEMQMLVH